MRRALIAAAVLTCAGVAVAANDQATPGPSAVTPLKVEIVIARYNGDKKVSSKPYTLTVNAKPLAVEASKAQVSLRMGVQVPISTVGKDGPMVNYKNVGTNIDCWVQSTDDGRFDVHLFVEESSLQEPQRRPADPNPPVVLGSQPAIRSFSSSFSLILRHGETAQYLAATDPLSGEVLKVDVSVTAIGR